MVPGSNRPIGAGRTVVRAVARPTRALSRQGMKPYGNKPPGTELAVVVNLRDQMVRGEFIASRQRGGRAPTRVRGRILVARGVERRNPAISLRGADGDRMHIAADRDDRHAF